MTHSDQLDYEALAEFISRDLESDLHQVMEIPGVYGYALLPGPPGNIPGLVSAYVTESQIADKIDDKYYTYYRYSVDEWKNYRNKSFERTNAEFKKINKSFKTNHVKIGNDFRLDESEILHACNLYNAILTAFKNTKNKVFGKNGIEHSLFMAIWVSDSSLPILHESVKVLNSKALYDEFNKLFNNNIVG